jgi:hypothetical protein
MNILSDIQSKLKAPKGQMNKFGNYKYRSCEDIVEAVKPLLAEHDLALVISDEIISVSDRIYVKATACLTDGEKNLYTASASAREALTKKGMDEAQVTGAASSYARKYALNGLFAIDDTKDADTMDNRIDNTVEPRLDYINKAYQVYKEEVENEMYEENGDFNRMQQVNHYLTNDERIAVEELFGKETVPNGKKMLKTIVRELLTKTEADNG